MLNVSKEARAVIFLGIVVVSGLGIAFCLKGCDPLDGTTPAVIEQFTEVKTICENRVKDLKEAGINGKAEYEKVQLETNTCIGWLQGVLDDGHGDREEIERRLRVISEKCNTFNEWAKDQLPKGQAEGYLIDLGKVASDLLKLLDAQEKARREAVKRDLEKCKLPSWQDIPTGAGAMK